MTTSTAVQKRSEVARREPALRPAVDIVEDAGGITLYADLPGVSKDRLTVQVEGDVLSIEGELSLDLPADLEATYSEVTVPRYRRAFTLSRELDSTRMSAELKNGVLRLRIPKAEEAKPRRIPVTVG